MQPGLGPTGTVDFGEQGAEVVSAMGELPERDAASHPTQYCR